MSDKKNVLGPHVSRREFVQGVMVGVAAISGGAPAWATDADYPPAKVGMRGAHVGAFEVAHQLAREGKSWPEPSSFTDEPYDLVVVGAGISGLSTALFYQQAFGPQARILLLDNHDDFGGHAKRNEFSVAGRTLIGYGGSQSIDSPGSYSTSAKRLLKELGVEVERFYHYYDKDYFKKRKLQSGLFLNARYFGERRLLQKDLIYSWQESPDVAEVSDAYLRQFPFADGERAALKKLLTSNDDFLPELDLDGKQKYLQTHSYSTYLTEKLKLPPKVLALVEERLDGWWGLGTDAISGMEALRNGLPGLAGLAIPLPQTEHGNEPYIFHFPDGNASIARLLVQRLIPAVAPGVGMDDIVKARFDYSQLDLRGGSVRLRLKSTVVHTENRAEGVHVTYVQDGVARRVLAKHAVLACYNAIIPFVCPSLPDAQKVALREQVKVPMAYVNVALTNWRALAAAGVSDVSCPRSFFNWVTMDFPVSMGGYAYTQSPDQPVLLHMPFYPKTLGQGMAPKDQYRLGRYRLLSLSFADFEREIVAQLTEMLGPYGFDAARDISAITVNRWPHGYAYEYIDLFDPQWAPGTAPHERARVPFGNIHIGNSDSQAFAYVDGAIDAARRVVDEIVG